MVRIVIADDVDLTLVGAEMLLKAEPDFEVVGVCHYLPDLLLLLNDQPVDVILVGEMRDYETIETALTAAETGHLVLTTLHTVAQANGWHAAIGIAGPGVHRHRVGVIQEDSARFGDFADVLAHAQQCRDGPLAVHDAPGANRIANTLIHAIFQRNINVHREGF